MASWKPGLTAFLVAAALLAWLHFVVTAPDGMVAWFDRAVFWSCAAALALLWGPKATRTAARFLSAWYRTSSRQERRRLLALATVSGLLLRFGFQRGVAGVSGLVLFLLCGLALLIVVARQDLRRWRAGERLLALKWFFLLGFLASFGYVMAYLVLSDGARADPVPGLWVGVVFFWGLVILAIAHLVRWFARRLR